MEFAAENTVVDYHAHIRKLRASVDRFRGRDLGYWSIVETGREDCILGWVMLIPFNEQDKSFETGWRLAPEVWGHGLGREAATAILNHAFDRLGARDIWALIHPNNTRSLRLAARLGLSDEQSCLRRTHRLFRLSCVFSKTP